MAVHNLVWVRAPLTWGVIPGWADTICSIDFMSPGLVSKSFLIHLPDCFYLVLHGLLWGFTNRQATQGGGVLTLLVFLGIIPLLESLRRYLKEQWFSL